MAEIEILVRDTVTQLPVELPGKDYFPSVPDGTYAAKFIGAESLLFFDKAKVCLWFRIDGEHLSVSNMVARYFNVDYLVGKPRKSGRRANPEFTVGVRSALTREISRLFLGRFSPLRLPTRIPKELSDKLVLVEVKKSKRDRNGDLLVAEFRESRITKILGWVDAK